MLLMLSPVSEVTGCNGLEFSARVGGGGKLIRKLCKKLYYELKLFSTNSDDFIALPLISCRRCPQIRNSQLTFFFSMQAILDLHRPIKANEIK